jgi:hypothetical protein
MFHLSLQHSALSHYYTIAFDSRRSLTSKYQCVAADQIEVLKYGVLGYRVQTYNPGTTTQNTLQQQLMPRYSNFQDLQFYQMKYNLQSIPKHETMNNEETTSEKERIAARLATANPLGL